MRNRNDNLGSSLGGALGTLLGTTLSVVGKAITNLVAFGIRFATRSKTTLILVIVVAILLCCSVISLGLTSVISRLGKTTSLELENIGELATQVAFYTNVQKLNEAQELFGWKVPFTESQYIFSYDGTIKAGYNFEEIVLDVDILKKVITVTLPEIIVISNEIDESSFIIYDEQTSIFTPLKLEEVNQSLAQIREQALEKAVERGLYLDTRENAKLLITGFLAGAYDLTEYTIEFK